VIHTCRRPIPAPALWIGAALLLVACSAAGAPVSSSPKPTTLASIVPIPTSPSGDLPPVSISHPSAGAKDAFAKCHIGDMILIEKVAGMAQVPSAKDVVRYVPLTGREPQLKEDGPAWVIQIKGEVQQRGSEIWIDPTCVVTAGDFGFYATGPVKNTSTGDVMTPEEPSTPPDRTLPPLVP
jgi:hypothetical protein